VVIPDDAENRILETIQAHRRTRFSTDRSGFCRCRCECGWSGSPWDGRSSMWVEEEGVARDIDRKEQSQWDHDRHLAFAVAEALMPDESVSVASGGFCAPIPVPTMVIKALNPDGSHQ